MSGSLIIVIIAAVVVCFIAVAIPVRAECREKRRREEEEKQERIKQERKAEARRVAKVKRLARQRAIGDDLFRELVEYWKLAGCPARLTPHCNSRNFAGGDDGNYYIDFRPPDSVDPIHIKVWIVLDLREENREVCITGDSKIIGADHLFLPLGPGLQFIRNILAYRLFS